MRIKATIVSLLMVVLAMSQNSSISAGISPGFLLAHRADLKNIESHITSIELVYQKNESNSWWGKQYIRPIVGYGLSYYYFGKPETGAAITAISNLKFGLFTFNKSQLNFRLGTGIGYLTKKFDAVENRRNIAIGSHINGFMQTALLMNHTIGRSELEYGITLSHFSNGAFTVPNLGYNMPGLFFRYSLPLAVQSTSEQSHEKIKAYDQRPWSFSISIIYAHKERDFSKPVKFNHWGIQTRILSHSNPIKSWRLGIDMMMDKSYIYAADNLADLSQLSFGDQYELGIAAGHEWTAGKVRLIGEFGAYIYNPTDLKRPTYQRMGFFFDASKNIAISGTLKFHRGVADYLEWGVSYKLRS